MKLAPIRTAVALLTAFTAVVPVSVQAQQEPLEFRLRYPGLQVTDPEGGSPSVPLLQLSTKLVDFGDVATNTTESRQVLVSNEGTAGLTFTAAPAVAGHAAFGTGLTTCGPTLAAGADCLTDVSFSPTSVGAVEGLLTFSTPLADSPHGVTLKGTAYNPVSLKAATLPDSTVGAAFSYDFKPLLEVSNESSPEKSSATWLVTSGSVPAGLQLDSATGVLWGVPTEANAGASFSVTATYKKNQGQQAYVLSAKAPLTISAFGGYRAWSDGSFAKSCLEYRSPSSGKTYSGSVGDGVYRIQPSGQSETNVYCDMTGGGYTLLGKAVSNSYTTQWGSNTTGLNIPASPSPSTTVTFKYSESFINALSKQIYRVQSTQSYPVTRFWDGRCIYATVQATSAYCRTSYSNEALSSGIRSGSSTVGFGGLHDNYGTTGYFIATQFNSSYGWGAGNGISGTYTGTGSAGSLVTLVLWAK